WTNEIPRPRFPSERPILLAHRTARPRKLSAADLRHRARGADESALVDPMLELLVGDRLADRRRQLRVGGSVAERGLEIPFPGREEAGAELAVGGDADPVAGRAERLRDGVDEADLALPVGEAVALGGRRGLRGELDE